MRGVWDGTKISSVADDMNALERRVFSKYHFLIDMPQI